MTATTSESATSLLLQAVVGKATALARAGRHTEAAQQLVSLPPAAQETPVVLDLLARIYAQQGRLREAEALWQKVRQIDPNHQPALDGLKQLEKMQRWPVWWLSVMPWVVGAVVVCVVGLLAWRFERDVDNSVRALRAELAQNPTRSAPAAVPPAVTAELAAFSQQLGEIAASLRTVAAQQQELSQQLQGIRAATVQPPPPVASLTPPPVPVPPSDFPASLKETSEKLAVVPGISFKAEGADLVVVFNEGLFENRDELTPPAHHVLTTVGRALEPRAGDLAVRVIGHTDNLPVVSARYAHNVDLGLRRARAAIEHLVKAVRLPREMFKPESLGETQPPFPNDTAENRVRNRTVVLRIAAARPPTERSP